MIHQDIREWVARLLRLDLSTASPDELAKLTRPRWRKRIYVRQLLVG